MCVTIKINQKWKMTSYLRQWNGLVSTLIFTRICELMESDRSGTEKYCVKMLCSANTRVHVQYRHIRNGNCNWQYINLEHNHFRISKWIPIAVRDARKMHKLQTYRITSKRWRKKNTTPTTNKDTPFYDASREHHAHTFPIKFASSSS